MKQNSIPVFFTIDEGYAPYLDCAIRSMMDNADRSRSYKIHVLHENLTEESIQRLKSAVQPPFSIEFTQMKEGLESITDREENKLRCDYFTLTIYFRLFIAEMFPEYDRGIYIDSDVIVSGDIAELFDTDLGDRIIGACPDHSVSSVPELGDYMEQAVGVDRYSYINSGVLLMNLKKMRETGFTEHFLYLLNTYHFDSVAPDQDYLNAMCYGDILFLDEEWDAMPPETEEQAVLAEPKLIHYNLFQKPWCYDGIPYKEYFWKYAEQSPFYDRIREHKENYSEEQKQSDRDCQMNMIVRAQEIMQKQVTMKKVLEKGESVRIGAAS